MLKKKITNFHLDFAQTFSEYDIAGYNTSIIDLK